MLSGGNPCGRCSIWVWKATFRLFMENWKNGKLNFLIKSMVRMIFLHFRIVFGSFWKKQRNSRPPATSGDLRRPPATSGKRKFKKVNFPKNLFFLRLRRPPATSGHPFFLKFWKKPPPATSGDLREAKIQKKWMKNWNFRKTWFLRLRRPPATSGDLRRPIFLKNLDQRPIFLENLEKNTSGDLRETKNPKNKFFHFPNFP